MVEIQKKFIGKERNLFIINYPLQLLNAIEAQKHFNTNNNVLVIFYYEGQQNNYKQLMELIKRFDYSKLIIYEKKSMDFMISLIKEIQKEKYIKVFTGFFSLNSRRLLANTTYNELYLVDDGVYSIAIHNQLYSNDTQGYKNYITTHLEHEHTSIFKHISFYVYNYYRKVYLKLLGYNNEMNSMNLNFYTIFDLPQYKDEVIIKNDYKFLTSYYANRDKITARTKDINSSDTIYFLGQPLYRSLPIDYVQYLSYLRAIFLLYTQSKKKLIYIPHRGEEEIFENIEKLYPGFIEVHKLSQPFELYLLENDIPIKYLASFVSSALFTVKKLYPNITIDAFMFPINGEVEKNVLLIHKMLKKNGANLLEITKNNIVEKKDMA